MKKKQYRKRDEAAEDELRRIFAEIKDEDIEDWIRRNNDHQEETENFDIDPSALDSALGELLADNFQ